MNSALPSPQKLSALVAMTSEGVIGRDGDLPWHLPADLRFFKETTSGHAIVMGRQTYESIGRPLPKRQNIVLTRDRQFVAPGCELIHSPDKLAELPPFSDTTYIIGGAQIYRLFLPTLDELIITHVHEKHPGDTFFPPYQDHFSPVETLAENADFRIVRYQARR